MNLLSQWINDKYLVAYARGKLYEEHCQHSPYKFAVLEDFLQPKAAEKIYEACQEVKLEVSHEEGLAKGLDWEWGAFRDVEIIRAFLGKDFRQFFNSLLGEELRIKKDGAPQFNRFRPNGRGMKIHNDMGQDIDLVMLLQLTKNYQPEMGGKFNIHKSLSGERYELVKAVAPKFNTLVTFKVCSESYHSVSKMNGSGWVRENLAIDWSLAS